MTISGSFEKLKLVFKYIRVREWSLTPRFTGYPAVTDHSLTEKLFCFLNFINRIGYNEK